MSDDAVVQLAASGVGPTAEESDAVVRRVDISMDGLHDVERTMSGLCAERDDIEEELVACSPAMFMEPQEERVVRSEAPCSALEEAAWAGMPAAALVHL